MRNRDVVGINLVAVNYAGIRGKVGDDLMAVKVEIDPIVRTSALFATQDPAIKLARLVEVADRKCKMKKVHKIMGNGKWTTESGKRPKSLDVA
jgi:hypothetical protein